MALLDYGPAALAFAFAILGVAGKTTDDSKHGIRRITKIGWVVVTLSAISLSVGLFSVYSKNLVLDKRAVVADIKRARLTEGASLMLKPLCGSEELRSELDTSQVFAILRSDANLTEVGKTRAVKWSGSGGRLVAGSDSLPYQTFEEPYQLYDFYITEGEKLINNTLSSFGGYFSEDEIIALSTLISDSFLNGDYKLSGTTDYFHQGLDDEKRTGKPSPWNTLGVYYFNAIYEGPWARPGDLQPALDFLQKAEAAIDLIITKRSKPAPFNPCFR